MWLLGEIIMENCLSMSKQLCDPFTVDANHTISLFLVLFVIERLWEVSACYRSKFMTESWLILRTLDFVYCLFKLVAIVRWLLADFTLLEKLNLLLLLPRLRVNDRMTRFFVIWELYWIFFWNDLKFLKILLFLSYLYNFCFGILNWHVYKIKILIDH